jgi:acetyl/propionyl-CoA carboxylase alpha subunit
MTDGQEPSHLEIERAGEGAWRVTDASGWSTLVHVALSGEGCWVHVDGDVFVFDAGRDPGRPRAATTPEASLSAPMPATVMAIVAPAGTPVEEGDVLLLLEAMKMELPVRAPRAGTVTAVHCREGQLVQPGVTLVDLA